ncbi:gliding motility-associated C-terminal domain-containing protein, partial [Flavobacterium sp. SUN052]|uniref:HYR-like domain-containing protein n=1 Tax=Flavobacterium sp. SUN052 TaxID=3002441 RepID=UPI002DBB7620
ATDACGNTSTASQTINVQDTTAPVIAALPAATTIACGTTPAFATATATDACGSAFTLTFNDVTTNGACAGSYSVTRTWSATDACGNTSTASQTINVQDTTAPVIAALPAATTIACGTTPVFATATATDACGSAFTLTFNDVTTNGACAGSYSVTRTWTATDACGNTSNASQTINVQDTTAPVISSLPAATTIACGTTPVFATATATDACGSAFTLTFNDVTTNGACAGSYSVTRTWTATDTCGNTSTASQTINVQDTTAPVIAALPAATTIACSTTPVFATATATDACGSAFTLTYNDVTTNGACAGSYSVTRTWTATDACGNTSNASQTINVQDTTAPVIAALPEAATIACGTTPVFATATATDACGSTFTLTFNDVTTNGACAGSYSVTRTWTATDACGNTSNASQTINVQDTTAPVLITAYTAVVNVTCNLIPIAPQLQFTDDCSSTPITVVFNETTSIVTTSGTYVITRTWIATDACGNPNIVTQTINVTITNFSESLAVVSQCNGDISLSVNVENLINNQLPGAITSIGTWSISPSTIGFDPTTGIFTPFGVPVGNYIVTYQNNDPSCPSTVNVSIPVDDSCVPFPCASIIVHNALTPNGDAINDYFYIENIDDTVCYPENTVEIYNRWGIKVYDTTNYDNKSRVFRGESEGRTTIKQSDELPTGTYFYILKYKGSEGNTNTKTGYLYLSR